MPSLCTMVGTDTLVLRTCTTRVELHRCRHLVFAHVGTTPTPTPTPCLCTCTRWLETEGRLQNRNQHGLPAWTSPRGSRQLVVWRRVVCSRCPCVAGHPRHRCIVSNTGRPRVTLLLDSVPGCLAESEPVPPPPPRMRTCNKNQRGCLLLLRQHSPRTFSGCTRVLWAK